jgi:apolipoprotein N-acyltransferase
MKAALRHLPLAGSAVLFTLTFSPFNLTFLCFVALAPWLAHLRGLTPKQARRSGFSFGLLVMGWQLAFIVKLLDGWFQNLFVAIPVWLAATAFVSLFFLLAAWLIQRCWSRGWWWLIPFVWAGVEALRATLPGLALPWANVGHPLWAYPFLAQSAAWGTVQLVSAWVMMSNVLVALLLLRPKGEKLPAGQPVYQYVVVFAAVLLASALRSGTSQAVERKVISLGQVGVDMAYTEPSEEARRLSMALFEAEGRAMSQGSELLIFPEAVLHRISSDVDQLTQVYRPGIPTIAGGRYEEDGKTYQAAYVWDLNEWTHAEKTKLVAFGEYVPFRDVLDKVFKLPPMDLQPGRAAKAVNAAGSQMGTMVCFEGLFAELGEELQRKGARALVQISIDCWYAETPAWDQLWQQSVWRSIEMGAPMLRVGATGRSLVTDSRGNIISYIKTRDEQTMRVEVPLPIKPDGFAYRTWFWWACGAICAFVWAWPAWKDRRRKSAE